MATSKIQTVQNGDRKVKQKPSSSSSVRIKQRTKAKLEQLLRQTDKDRIGRKIKQDDVLCFSLELLNGDHVAEICNKSLSNKDRMELCSTKSLRSGVA